MHCEACGARTNPGARFCAACGAPLARVAPSAPEVAPRRFAPEPPAPPVPFAPAPTPPSHPDLPPNFGALAPHHPLLPAAYEHLMHAGMPTGMDRWQSGRFYCPSCERPTVPVPYFSRGVNLAKGAAMLPVFFPVVSLLFFFARRDRAVCSECKSILPGETSLSLLDSFSRSPVALLGPGGYQGGGDALTRSADAVHQEIAIHDNKSRRSKRRATSLGITTLALAGLGGMAAVDEGVGPATFLFSMGGLSGVGAFSSSRRSKRHKLAAEAKRQRFRVLEVLNLARAHQGKLTVTTVAAQLQLDLREAETLLDSMLDGRRVDVHVDEGGRLTYVFTELAG